MLNVTDFPRPAGRFAAALLALVSALLLGCGESADESGSGAPAGAPRGEVDFGASLDFSDGTEPALDEFEATTGVTPRYVLSFRDWNPEFSTALINPDEVDPVYDRGGEPVITWLPTLPEELFEADPRLRERLTPRAIAAGSADEFIARAADEAAADGRPIWVRLAHEMNGDWNPWGAGVDGNTPRDYIAMWRHVVEIFRKRGADNVRWAWTPNVVTDDNGVARFEPFYPGDEWVDAVGLDGYNFGADEDSSWRDFEELFVPSYTALTRLTGKPIVLSEVGASEDGGDKAAWLSSIGPALERMPRVEALIWFDRAKEEDWRLSSSPESLAAFRDLVGGGVLAADAASE